MFGWATDVYLFVFALNEVVAHPQLMIANSTVDQAKPESYNSKNMLGSPALVRSDYRQSWGSA